MAEKSLAHDTGSDESRGSDVMDELCEHGRPQWSGCTDCEELAMLEALTPDERRAVLRWAWGL